MARISGANLLPEQYKGARRMNSRRLQHAADRILRTAEIARNRLGALVFTTPAEGHALMLHTGRSGSTVVGNLLQQHSRIYWDGEVYEKMFVWVRARQGVLVRDQKQLLGPDDAWPYLDGRRKRAGAKLYGFECRDYHLDWLKVSLVDYLRAAKSRGFTRIIVLERRNLLLKIVSNVVAETRNQHHVRTGVHVERPWLRLDLDHLPLDHGRVEILSALAQTKRWLEEADAAAAELEHLHLCYEDSIQNDPLAAYREVCAFLGVLPEFPKIALGRTTAFPLSQIIENFDELRERLRGTEFEWMTGV
jgi:hypothetical protein